MRILLFYIYAFLQLLCVGNLTYANTLSNNKVTNNKTLLHNSLTKNISEDQNIIFIDETDLDFEEEYQSNENTNIDFDREFLNKKHFYTNFWISDNNLFLSLNINVKPYKNKPVFLGYCCPFYFTKRILII